MENSKLNLSNEVKIGLVVLAAIIIAVIGFRVMKDQPLFRQSKFLHTTFDRVDALLPGNVVQIKGYKIGSVKSLEFSPETDSTKVKLGITADFMIPAGSKAVLKKPGPLGAVTIEIVKSESSESIPWGSYIPGEIDGGIFETFETKGEVLADELTKSLVELNSIMVKIDSSMYSDNRDPIRNTLNSFEKTGKDVQQLISKRKQDIDSMIVSMSNVTQNFDELTENNKEEIDSMLTNLKNASTELEKLSKGLNKTTVSLNEILVKINEGSGTFGKMINDESLYMNMDSLTFNLNELVKNIQRDPKKYLKHMRLIEVF
ncbi:MAG: MlaD family protein [Balneola sp.]